MLGFPTNRAVAAKSWATSTNAVDVNNGLRRVSLNCESINSSRNLNIRGRRSYTLFTFPVLPNQNLSSAVTYFGNIGSVAPIDNGLINSLTFTIDTDIVNDDVVHESLKNKVDVDIYFEINIKE